MSGPAPLPERYRGARRDPALVVLEGLHALKHALRFGAEIVDVRTRDPGALAELADRLAPDVAEDVVALSDAVDADTFERLSPTPHATGVIALARRPRTDAERILARGGPAPLVLLERPTHPGNIGAAIRAAAAANAGGVLVTGRHDPWHATAVRGAAGLQFALPVASLEPDGVAPVVAGGRPVVVLDPDGEPLAPDVPIPSGAVLVFGSEREGVTDALRERADRTLSIPMRAGVSSLNLATAVAVTLYVLGHRAG
jgi:TrmH family RNA methyltransferase